MLHRIAAAALCSLCINTVWAQVTAEQDVWKRVEELNHAVFMTRDATVIRSMVADPLTYGHSDGRIENRDQMVSNASNSANRYREAKTERVSVSVDGNTAITRHTFSALQTNAQGKEAPLAIGVLQVWLRHGGQWLLAGRQAVRLSTP
jgi:ketosteroid isomerase-like protein